METFFVKGRDIPDAWFQLVDLCYENGRDYEVAEGSYAKSQRRRELDHITVRITHPWMEPLLPEMPAGLGIPNPVPGGIPDIEKYLPYILTSQRNPSETYTYGERLFDKIVLPDQSKLYDCQIDEVIKKLRRDFRNNQACTTVAIPGDIHSEHPPCLRLLDFRVYSRGTLSKSKNELDDTKKLHVVMYYRSWDLWGGFPANLAALVYLQRYVADSVGVGLGEFICCSKGLHLYSMYWELARMRLGLDK